MKVKPSQKKLLSDYKKETTKEMKKVRELIKEFDLRLAGYDPGISATFISSPSIRGNGWGLEPISFTDIEWKWLKPILEELSERRKSNVDY